MLTILVEFLIELRLADNSTCRLMYCCPIDCEVLAVLIISGKKKKFYKKNAHILRPRDKYHVAMSYMRKAKLSFTSTWPATET